MLPGRRQLGWPTSSAEHCHAQRRAGQCDLYISCPALQACWDAGCCAREASARGTALAERSRAKFQQEPLSRLLGQDNTATDQGSKLSVVRQQHLLDVPARVCHGSRRFPGCDSAAPPAWRRSSGAARGRPGGLQIHRPAIQRRSSIGATLSEAAAAGRHQPASTRRDSRLLSAVLRSQADQPAPAERPGRSKRLKQRQPTRSAFSSLSGRLDQPHVSSSRSWLPPAPLGSAAPFTAAAIAADCAPCRAAACRLLLLTASHGARGSAGAV